MPCFWSASNLKSGVADWKEITPQPVQRAVEGLRRRFGEQTRKVAYIMEQGCYPDLHPIEENNTEPAVFSSYFYRCADALAKEVRSIFSELFAIASAQSTLISLESVEWAALQMKVLIADESYGVSLWLKNACDKQQRELINDPDEALHWKSWRAPKWFFMQPFASQIYERATAWERTDEAESKHLLEVVEDRFNRRLIMELEKAVDEAHVQLAKHTSHPNLQAPQSGDSISAPALGKRRKPQKGSGRLSQETHHAVRSLGGPMPKAGEEPKPTRRGQNIDRLRKECGLSFDVLAEKTGMDKKLILSHVNRRTKPHPRNMRLYADAFAKELGRPIAVTDIEQ